MTESLAPHPSLIKPRGPVVLCILDGVGIGDGGAYDAVARANTPTLDRLRATCPSRSLRAHGTAVGMPSESDLGNSEVGHNAMGAGRIFDQGAKLVDEALNDGSAFETKLWKQLLEGNTLHLLGLLSDGNVHSHARHLHKLIDHAVADGHTSIRVHILTDGRDVSARSALTWVEPLEARLAELRSQGIRAHIASGGGRMHMTMDRYEADWAMVKRGWDAHVLGKGRRFASASEAIRTLYAELPDTDDQWLPSFIVEVDGEPAGTIEDGDSVLLFNFRGDRAIEITRAFSEPGLNTFDRERVPEVLYAGMMEYDGDLKLPSNHLVAPPKIDRVVGEFLAAAELSSLAISETQKFGHVTFFYNGNRSERLHSTLEHWIEVPSDNVPFEQRPWMKAAEVTDAVLEVLEAGERDVIRINYANGDMVGHSGQLRATIVAMEALDLQLARLEKACRLAGAVLLITADHGNADDMAMRDKKTKAPQHDERGRVLPRTSHTLAAVPLILVDPTGTRTLRQDLPEAGIANLGATVLELCGLTAPHDYLPGLVVPS